MNKTIEIRHRWTNSCLWTGEIEASGTDRIDLGRAVLAARKAGAYLQGADLQGAKGAELAIARTRILPEGSLIGWKKCENSRIVKLRIPEDAKRSHAFGRKCRAERAEVVAVYGTNNAPCKSAVASYDSSSVYRVGETVVPRNGFSEDWQSECEAGIHFYITREEAEAH